MKSSQKVTLKKMKQICFSVPKKVPILWILKQPSVALIKRGYYLGSFKAAKSYLKS